MGLPSPKLTCLQYITVGHIILTKGHRISAIRRVPMAVDHKKCGVPLIQAMVLFSYELFSFGINALQKTDQNI